jgi:DNA-binding transcriptional regulator YiaG
MGQPSKPPLEGLLDIPQVVEVVHRYRDKPKPDPPADPPAKTISQRIDSLPQGPLDDVLKQRILSKKTQQHRATKRRYSSNREGHMEAFGQRLQSIRKARGLTQSQFAKMVGVSRREVQFWEAGARAAYSRLPDIAAALQCTIADLLNIGGPIPPPEKPTNDDVRRHAQAMLGNKP